jgi:hypothetical protein
MKETETEVGEMVPAGKLVYPLQSRGQIDKASGYAEFLTLRRGFVPSLRLGRTKLS